MFEMAHMAMAEINDVPPTSLLEARAPEYDALQDALERLHDTICPDGTIPTLLSRKLLTRVEAETVRSKATTHEKNEELLFAILRRSPAQVLQFCQFLLEKQSHCGDILKEGKWLQIYPHTLPDVYLVNYYEQLLNIARAPICEQKILQIFYSSRNHLRTPQC